MLDGVWKSIGFAALAALLAGGLAACGSDAKPATSSSAPPVTEPSDCESGPELEGTFDAVQTLIFDARGCTNGPCHGESAAGGLDLRAGASYDNLLNVPAAGSSLNLVHPGDRYRSYLYAKLAAALDPSIEISGAAMPNGLPPLTDEELELVRRWIVGGAPRSGTLEGTEELIAGCVPEAEPVVIEPLAPPASGEGVQFVMPEWDLLAASEDEVCFATYYDLTGQVPAEFLNEDGTAFRFDVMELRQDAQSHHLLLDIPLADVDPYDPSFGSWICKGGAADGETCDPKDLGACGQDSWCGSEVVSGPACIGWGPQELGGRWIQIGGAQQAQALLPLYDGVYEEFPIRGVLRWNSHAFNLTTSDTKMHARLNYSFAEDQVHEVRRLFDATQIFLASAPPFTTEVVCHDHVFPRGTRLFTLTSHTHKRGKHFTVELGDGTQIYESFLYSDPVYARFDPPLAFDSESRADRTVRFCSLYNNGVAEDGSPDLATVTRSSETPPNAFSPCRPIACVNDGMIGEPCTGVGDHAACDSSPGANDSWCDACRITGGVSTENEMFILIGLFWVEP